MWSITIGVDTYKGKRGVGVGLAGKGEIEKQHDGSVNRRVLSC